MQQNDFLLFKLKGLCTEYLNLFESPATTNTKKQNALLGFGEWFIANGDFRHNSESCSSITVFFPVLCFFKFCGGFCASFVQSWSSLVL